MVASGRLDGGIYLEDLNDLVPVLVASGRLPRADRWVVRIAGDATAEELGSMM